MDHTKTVEDRIVKFSPYGSPIPLVFVGKFHPEILRDSPEGASNKGRVVKISSFLSLSTNISKMVADTAKVTIKMTNRKSHMGFSLTPRSMTLDDLELLQGQILSDFCVISRFWGQQGLNES